jgi:hypothetical protein
MIKKKSTILFYNDLEHERHKENGKMKCAALWGEPLEPLSVRRLSDVSGTDCIGRFESPQHDGNHDDPLWNYDTISWPRVIVGLERAMLHARQRRFVIFGKE